MKIIQDIQPRGMYSAYVGAPFDKAKQDLESKGYSIISLEQNARLRMQEGKDSFVSRNGNWTREAFLYNPETNLWYLTKKSPIMDFPVEAVQAHREGREYLLTNEQVQRALENSVEVKDREIPTDRFGEDPLAVYAFGDSAQDYGLFLKDANIKKMPIWLPDSREKPFAKQLWFWNLGGRSDLGGSVGGLRFDGRLRGVRDAEGIANAKNLNEYTLMQIEEALNHLGLSGLEGILISELKNK